MESATAGKKNFGKYAQFVLAYTVIVIMWGAYVRATGSGAGCGDHWPTCNGEIIPRAPSLARIIEFSHRLSSGLSLLLVGGLVLFSRRVYAKGHMSRRAAVWSLGFIIGEALVGAMLVLLQLVAGNDSVLRAVVIAVHLVNTFLLLFWLTRVVIAAKLDEWVPQVVPLAAAGRAKFNVILCMVAVVVTGASGAIVALGDTLFPSQSLALGMAADFSPTAHFLIRLRVLHPLLAMVATGFILLQCFVLPRLFPGIVGRKLGVIVAGLIILQMCGGFLNLVLLAPVWMQLFHLMMADVTWIALCVWYFNIGVNRPGEQS